jgi:hypothetical protein
VSRLLVSEGGPIASIPAGLRQDARRFCAYLDAAGAPLRPDHLCPAHVFDHIAGYYRQTPNVLILVGAGQIADGHNRHSRGLCRESSSSKPRE